MTNPIPQPPFPIAHVLTGPENALALASVEALARGEFVGISPLVVHGPSGVGKSRLLASLVADWRALRPDSSVAHLEAETFAALCAEAAGPPAGWAEFRARFRQLDLFVLEDVHRLERLPMALEELSHTLDALDDAGAAVAVSARTGPGQWLGWPRRLVNHLSGGLAVRIDPPGLASRRRYLLERARARGLTLAAEAADRLAERADGYRALDGWLARLALTARLDGPRLDLAAVEQLLADEAAPSPVTIDAIARTVACRFGVRLADLRSASRRQTLVEPRHLAMHLARQATGLSFTAIGAYFGGRDPATVRHACRRAAQRLARDPARAALAAALAQGWRGGPISPDADPLG
jgi:chromosomal replication initiator protein